MTPHEFQRKWQGHTLTERASYQQHFLDLCALVGHPTPAEVDPTGASFCFEKAVAKQWGGGGFADVWKRDHFGWEYKGPHADLDKALHQLLLYRRDLENPPLLVVCDTDLIRVHTDFTNTANTIYEVTTADLTDPDKLEILRKVFHDPMALRPGRTPDQVTQAVASQVGDVAQAMRERGVEPHEAAHFLMKVVFALFAEDIGLLRRGLLTEVLAGMVDDPDGLDDILRQLFEAMATGGRLHVDRIDHFNGGLFDDSATVRLESEEIAALARIAADDWGQVEPAVFGTLFERGLDPARRAQLGAHYTSKEDILLVIEPVLMAPLRREWESVRAGCEELAEKAEAADTTRKRQNHRDEISARVRGFMERLAGVRVLDPACGSGNFLYVALNALKDLELEVIQATAAWSAEAPFPAVDPGQLYGLEIDPYAVELAQLTVWIGYLQWCQRHGFLGSDRPLLKKHDNIQQRDAILAFDEEGRPVEPAWPEVDVIVGNPPFLGDKKLRGELGDEYVERVFGVYKGRLPNGADLCCYWFERARSEIEAGRARRAGLLATNSIRQSANRVVLDRIQESGGIFMAWSDREWILDGAAVRISIVGFDDGSEAGRTLDGQPVERINADLTSTVDLTQAKRLQANSGLAFQGPVLVGPFDITSARAREFLSMPTNPNGRTNADVLAPLLNGKDIMDRPRGLWVINFGDRTEREAALYEAPFEYVVSHVKPMRLQSRDPQRRRNWWRLGRSGAAFERARSGLSRYVATSQVAKHRVFVWLPPEAQPHQTVIAFARDDAYFLGALQSRAHVVWALRLGSSLEDRPRYTPTTCFETFPFPKPTEEQRAAIAEAAKALHEMRQAALDNDPKLTMTALYNKRPTWLDNLHKDLDRAVLAAYGWPEDIGDEELLERLLALNLERAEEEERGILTRL
ncbi:MAG: class I SAM-dependent DNA methyltransferase [candidate division WS1 bacterium]|nr:class I SAM-dependent DNA methyltransferase [candidate division WS1 bacterium]